MWIPWIKRTNVGTRASVDFGVCFVMESSPPLIMKDDSAPRSEVNGIHGSSFFKSFDERPCYFTQWLHHFTYTPIEPKGFIFFIPLPATFIPL